MATVHTIEFHCPHCGKKLRSKPYNDHCSLGNKLYGNPKETCKRCKKTYFNTFTLEPALHLTTKQRVPFLLSSVYTLVVEVIVLVLIFTLAFMAEEFGILLLALPIVAFHVLLSAVTRSYRQKHKDRLLEESRKRLKEDVVCFVETVARTPMAGVDKTQLDAAKIALMHAIACKQMEADEVVNLTVIAKEVIASASSNA